MRKKHDSYIFIVLLAFALFLSGCQSGQKQAASVKNEEKTRVVKTINGNVKIPANPKRVVTIGYAATMLAFGIKPVGETGKYLENPYIKEQVSGMKDIGAKDGVSVSVEKIFKLKPDLIVSMNNDPKVYEKLSKIAPTVVYPFGTFKDAREEMKTFGELLGKEKEAEEWTKTFNQKMEAARAKLKTASVQDQTFSLIGAYAKSLYVYGAYGYRGGEAIYQQLGLTPPDSVKKDAIDASEGYKVISLEVLPQYAGDYIFVDESYSGKLDQDNSVWKSLDAVKNGRVFFLDPDRFWPYDPNAVQAQAEEIADMLVKQNEQAEK
ncbi:MULTISPECIES: iron-hydroxamate ABC transporter substrate-binding protein [Bacillus]|uniref:iron-hydroxamate ABC transporter substrate-binding protein n=1 Tax=Bacillus TaxID=1386 RepID=UPI00040D68A1|nr:MULTISPECIES: iron-hydroxamate ABC transporter substrate-binding protein [Bacillus]QHZ47836.1 iron-hydroxamate ABC transporter substrate-binding protein [Bacillus sp. NSP9.1]WFA03918.1 iron-hydroxamate ABC transporter substrate-binding protein [Bacillus sp. HSf4]